MMGNTGINDEDMRLWHMWKLTFKTIFNQILKETYGGTGLSEGDYMVLDLITQLGKGTLKQHELVEAMKWTKDRLSHHLTRMEKRGLIIKESLGQGKPVRVAITKDGMSAYDSAVPIISDGIRKYFIANLTLEDIESIERLAAKVNVVIPEFKKNGSK